MPLMPPPFICPFNSRIHFVAVRIEAEGRYSIHVAAIRVVDFHHVLAVAILPDHTAKKSNFHALAAQRQGDILTPGVHPTARHAKSLVTAAKTSLSAGIDGHARNIDVATVIPTAAVSTTASLSDGEDGAAAAIDPEAALIHAPAFVWNAR